jgi:hypothetical protein
VSSPHVEEIATIIDGHDSRLEALSLNDSLVKDADKLWRYTTTGVAVGCDWFGMTPREYADWVASELEHVIFTDVAKGIARDALTTTRKDLRI